MKKIELTQGNSVLVDSEDFDQLNQFKWHVKKHGKLRYAARTLLRKDGHGTVRMHCVIMKVPIGMEVDHKNGNGLDNRKKNLRLCTRAENSRNRGKSKNNTSGYKGVFYHIKARKWIAQIVCNRRKIYLGIFNDKKQAYVAYVKACDKYHGEYARY